MRVFNMTWHYAKQKNKPNNTTAFIAEQLDSLNYFKQPAWPKNIMNFWNEPLFRFYVDMDK
ncbi:hypothetical protein AAKU52_002930 [Pedobacter sp. CG_S7]